MPNLDTQFFALSGGERHMAFDTPHGVARAYCLGRQVKVHQVMPSDTLGREVGTVDNPDDLASHSALEAAVSTRMNFALNGVWEP